MRTTIYVAIAVAGAALALAGCGGGGGTTTGTTTTASEQTIKISEKEYQLTPKIVTLASAGTYTIKATNNGTTDHALTIEGNGLEETRTDTVGPHDSSSITVALKPGTYRIYCPVDGHQKLGMTGKIIVGGSATQTTPTQTTQTETTDTTSGYGG